MRIILSLVFGWVLGMLALTFFEPELFRFIDETRVTVREAVLGPAPQREPWPHHTSETSPMTNETSKPISDETGTGTLILIDPKRCPSVAAASAFGSWEPSESAPRDGTVVEMMQTGGIAPWYGLFQWDEATSLWRSPTDNTGTWDGCLFWRPYNGSIESYVDPTNGAQDSIAYWCAAENRPYDKKTDRCL